MQSFRTELENPIVEKDIIDLEKKIHAFREGKIHDEKFRSLRLARGVYGQRQPGVQMVRIKLPFGKVSFKQLLKIAEISDEFGSSNLHLTTRQDIQIHYVSLDRTPQLWAKLAQDDITLREACGNTVRNVTASPTAGVDPKEPFDVSPYAYATFDYFLRNPICQEMGRKFKISFSSSDDDTAFSYIHDIGAIPKINANGERGFKIMLGGGLGAQPILASIVEEFLPEDQLIPYIESVIRVFDRYGERNNRNKARMKYLIQKLGLDEVLRLTKIERTANKVKSYPINRDAVDAPALPPTDSYPEVTISNPLRYEQWMATNVFEQKQKGFYGVYIKVPVGDISSDTARALVKTLEPLVGHEIRITQNQGLLLKYVQKEALPALYEGLAKLELAAPGFDSIADVTTCPGTDTCNLGISNSMTMARVLEDLIYNEYEDFIYNREIKIKISGCMNSCGQHGLAHIGFHGSSLKAGAKVLPSVQVMLGGGTVGDGVGRAAERVIKVPTKRATDVLRWLLNDYKEFSPEGETYHEYYDRQGKDYFYRLLKPLADLTTLTDDEYIDWGHQETFVTAIGVGECAGVIIDLVATLLFESEEKLGWANEAYADGRWADAIYHAYNVFVSSAKALLLDKGVNSSTQIGVIREFDTQYVEKGEFELNGSFNDLVLQLNQNEPSQEFATTYLAQATEFLSRSKDKREALVQ
ncbi:HEPN domain-containing protein [Mucilaginibacter rubeus]|uniref:HEPN domain-containing protein n=1 Tax=Mucilaginibacter rubeus TaxID=2027860 RepID=A0AAE6JEA3_9SPHI|nr:MULTISPECIES: HEPN domain-containing protein [Mucilaginibacter]QEM04109.1 HEPN domain-containing protein [Mucilaginibacter rubeus]QEM16712.1 HEPN domain-containing protein [Mucilaginibacter gossypii]QTE46813.1 HEPN domain-containing protein [Mucilaginibacter rubeus]QTE53410.1 HEPN domain-containing protein [Mucilaginibacter rubeus]QTE58496.1 HEPN domain-containing protein [Mucilaginibacter rubeus]